MVTSYFKYGQFGFTAGGCARRKKKTEEEPLWSFDMVMAFG
jgi:hypothetical protein